MNYIKNRRAKIWPKICPKCKKEILYTYTGYYRAKTKGLTCKSCYNENRSNVGITKRKFWEVSCSECGKMRRYKFQQHYYRARNIYTRCQSCAKKHQIQSEETRRKRRERKARMFGGISYNPDACVIFEQINRELGLNGQHAENGEEKMVAGYMVDYYEPRLNIVIEYDEKQHEKQSQKKKDKLRQQRIIKELNCKFYRIKEDENWKEVLQIGE